MNKSLNYLFLSIFLILLFSCARPTESVQETESGEIPGMNQEFVVDTITTEINFPWGMTFLPENIILVTDKTGEVRVIENGKLLEEKVGGVPIVLHQGQGGLLDIKAHPNYNNNGFIYITYSKPGPDETSATALARAKFENNSFVDLQDIFITEPYVKSSHHFGSRIAFDNNGFLFVSTGERGTKPNSQNLENHYGKIHRLHDDGRIPEDNPFVNEPNAKPSIWSYGHRNVQGMTFDKNTNILWAHEHGPKGGDEINLVQKAKNYGWPLVTYGTDYDGSVISDKTQMEGVENPVHYWNPSIAPCGMTVVSGNSFPGWEGNLLIGALAHMHVARVVIKDGKYQGEQKLLDKVGRVRTVNQGPDGNIYVGTEAPGMILRLSPKK
jgi:aldose sugar dehydrogenase